MPKESIIAEGKTTNEAIENGLKELKVSKNMVDIKVLENEDKRSFFSILAPRVVKVELTVEHVKKERKPATAEALEEAEKNVKIFLDQFLEKMGDSIKYTINKDEFGLEIIIEGKEAGSLIGYRGETLYAMQAIISAVANKNSTEKIRVLVDIENYKAKREKALEDLAIKL